MLMSVKLTIRQLQRHLPEFLDRVVSIGEECVVQRNGKDYAVIVSAQAWRRRALVRRFDGLGPAYRLSRQKQQRAEELLTKDQQDRLTRAERRELDALLRECDAVMLRRARAMERVL
jgi:prevent-host-death family protein